MPELTLTHTELFVYSHINYPWFYDLSNRRTFFRSLSSLDFVIVEANAARFVTFWHIFFLRLAFSFV